MQPFLTIAVAHFLALILPGPDFILLARTSLCSGWRVASGVCIGIALANGVFIVAAFAGLAVLQPDSGVFIALQFAGCAYLLRLGLNFLRNAGRDAIEASDLTPKSAGNTPTYEAWRRAAAMGFGSGILNPKNALFYASLAAMLTGPHATPAWKTFYGAWMFSVVALWDLGVAAAIGNPRVLPRFARALPWIERLCGMALILLATGVALTRLR